MEALAIPRRPARRAKVRAYRPDDFDRLYEVDHAAFVEEYAFSAEELREYIDADWCETLIAEEEGEIVGFVIGGMEESRNGAGYIVTLDVVPGRQRGGIGRLLMAAIEGRLWDEEAEAVLLETVADETGARGFYEKIGYELVEHLPGYYENGNDAYRLVKRRTEEGRGAARC